MGSAVAQGLAKPVVAPIDRIVSLGLRDFAQTDELGEVLAQQTTGVLVDFTLHEW